MAVRQRTARRDMASPIALFCWFKPAPPHPLAGGGSSIPSIFFASTKAPSRLIAWLGKGVISDSCWRVLANFDGRPASGRTRDRTRFVLAMTNDQRSFAKALIGAISFLTSFVILSLAVSEGVTDRLDSTVRSIAHNASSPALTASMDVATHLGSASLLAPLFLASCLYLYLVGLRRQAAILVITMAGAVILENGLKLLVHRARPEPFFGVVAPETYSFPSGQRCFRRVSMSWSHAL
jgi:hypothetical protein